MSAPDPRDPGSDRSLVFFLLSLAALLSPAMFWWAGPGNAWWTVFAIWGGLIVLCALTAAGRDHDA